MTRYCVAAALAALLAAAEATAADPLGPALARLRRIGRAEWSRPAPPAPVPFGAEIRDAARRHGLSGSLLAALVRVESAFDPGAVSVRGARGLGQLMPATARALRVRDPFDAEQNLDGSARYLATQLERFGNLRLALGAYHAGPGRAARGLSALPRETRAYVARVLSFERDYRRRGLP